MNQQQPSENKEPVFSIIRRCHICHHVNESEEEILRCFHCGKAFLPLNYFEKGRGLMRKISQNPESSTSTSIPHRTVVKLTLNPVKGLIVLW
ncbi:MAG: hypothetical protein AB7F43_05305 [Bacteriovoracia bacterium]